MKNAESIRAEINPTSFSNIREILSQESKNYQNAPGYFSFPLPRGSIRLIPFLHRLGPVLWHPIFSSAFAFSKAPRLSVRFHLLLCLPLRWGISLCLRRFFSVSSNRCLPFRDSVLNIAIPTPILPISASIFGELRLSSVSGSIQK